MVAAMLVEHSFEVRDDFGACCTPVREPSAAEHDLVLPQTAQQRRDVLHAREAGKTTVCRPQSNPVVDVATFGSDHRRVPGHRQPANHRAYSTDGIADVWGMVGNAIVISHVVCLFESLSARTPSRRILTSDVRAVLLCAFSNHSVRALLVGGCCQDVRAVLLCAFTCTRSGVGAG